MAEETWSSVPGFEGLYEVSTLGRVRSLPRTVHNAGSGHTYVSPSRIMKQRTDKDGYRTLGLKPQDGPAKQVKVHRLVAMAFLPNPSSAPEVDHKNRDRADNTLENLRWATVPQNRVLPEYAGKGVRYREGKNRPWQAYTSLLGKFKSIGSFFTSEDAAAARAQFMSKGVENGEARAS